MSTARKITRRKGVRTQFSKVLNEALIYLQDDDVTEVKLRSLERSLRAKLESLKKLDEEIEELIDEAELEKSVGESLEFYEPSHEVFANIEIRLRQLQLENRQETGSLGNVSVNSNSSVKVTCKLPKLEIPSFSGDPLDWQGFWDQFDVSVNLNENVSDVDKFNYLLRFLKGKALSAVKGLSLSSENYGQALSLLKSRFGNPQVLISAHLDKLIKIKKVKSIENVEGLRNLFNEVETCVRNLKSLKVETDTYGCLLIPILKEKIPDVDGYFERFWK